VASDNTDHGAEEKADGMTDERSVRRRGACSRVKSAKQSLIRSDSLPLRYGYEFCGSKDFPTQISALEIRLSDGHMSRANTRAAKEGGTGWRL
jgi:hypothetical protein